MSVFLLRAEADRTVCEAVARAAERRGQFVEEERGVAGGRTLREHDSAILFWSSSAAGAAEKEGLERRALEAWALDRLTIVRVDADAPLPQSLKDLPALPARALLSPETLVAQAQALASPSAATAKPGSGVVGRAGPPFAEIAVLSVAVTAGAVAAASAMEVLPLSWFAAAFALALAAALGAVTLGLRRRARAQSRARHARAAAAIDPQRPPVLIGIAGEDVQEVQSWSAPLAAVEGPLAMVLEGASGSALAKAVEGARAVLIVCSPAGFAAPLLRRLAFLADRSGRPLTPVYVRPAPAPDDLAYYFAGCEPLELFRLDKSKRAAAVAAALPPV